MEELEASRRKRQASRQAGRQAGRQTEGRKMVKRTTRGAGKGMK